MTEKKEQNTLKGNIIKYYSVIQVYSNKYSKDEHNNHEEYCYVLYYKL